MQCCPCTAAGPKTKPSVGWSDTQSHVQQSIRTRSLIPPGASVLIAVSGGQDSLALAYILCGMAKVWGWRLGIAHCDHRWRVDSAANAEHVRSLSEAWQLPFHLCVAPDPTPRTEGSARAWRYGALAETASRHGYSHVATGHTASDRAETLLLNLMRGTGLDGMQALAWTRPIGGSSAPVTDDEALDSGQGVRIDADSSSSGSSSSSIQRRGDDTPSGSEGSSSSGSSRDDSSSGSRSVKGDESQPFHTSSRQDPHPPAVVGVGVPTLLVRPLLAISRQDTGALCEAAALPIYLDSTNKDITLRRNRVRLELLPYLRTHFNARLDQGLARTAETLVADVEYLEGQSRELLQRARQAVQPEAVRIRKQKGGETKGSAVPTRIKTIPGSAVNCTVLSAAPLALQRRALRSWLISGLGGEVKMDYVEAVAVFSKTYCPYCVKAKKALMTVLPADKFFVLELENRSDEALIQDALLAMTGGRSVPRVFVDGQFIGGGDDTAKMASNGQLKALLERKGAL
ncbi:MAG: hypothetical protein WDW38_003103 [Sanguina aurantia]